MKELKFEDLKVGMKVFDNDEGFGEGIIKDYSDIHNIEVEFLPIKDETQGGSGLYCLDVNCEEYDKLYKID